MVNLVRRSETALVLKWGTRLEGLHAVFSLFRLYPGLHAQTFALAAELLGQSALQLFPSSCTFWPEVVQSVQVCPTPSPVHVLQLGPPLLSHCSI